MGSLTLKNMNLRQKSDQNRPIKMFNLACNHSISYVAGTPYILTAPFYLTLTHLPTPQITSECFLGKVAPTNFTNQADNSITSAIWYGPLSKSL